jgi:transposase
MSFRARSSPAGVPATRCRSCSFGDQPIAAIAKELSISESCLRNWLAQADADQGRSGTSRLSSDDKRELAELRKKARRLEVENEILKRAAAYFARENVLPK